MDITYAKIFDLGRNGLQLTDDSVTRLKNEFATNDPNVVFSYIPLQDDHTERLVEMCSLEMFLLQNVNANDKVIIIADTRHTQKWPERKVDPMLCKRDLAFFCKCPVTLESLRFWAHERTPGIPRDLETVDRSHFGSSHVLFERAHVFSASRAFLVLSCPSVYNPVM